MIAWSVLVFGAPGALLGLGLCAAGLLRKEPWWLVAGGLALAPSSLYLGGHPGLQVLLLLPLLPLLAALILHRGRQLAAGLLLIPNAGAAAWLILATLGNITGF